MDNNEAIEAIFPLSRGDLKKIFKKSVSKGIRSVIDLIKKIRKERFDIALDFSLDYRYSLLLRILGVKRIAGYDYKGRGRFLTARLKINGFSDKPVAEYDRDLLRTLGIDIGREETELPLSKADEEFAKDFFDSNGIKEKDLIIGLALGGGESFGRELSKLKRWDIEKFASLTDKIYGSLDAKIIVFWGPGEEDLVDGILKSSKKAPIVIPKTSLRQMAAIMKRCDLIVANDSGPLYIAVSQGVKTVSIFGPTDEKVYGPYPPSDNRVTVTKDLDCRPCYVNFKVPDCKTIQCLKEINPEDVFRAVKSLVK